MNSIHIDTERLARISVLSHGSHEPPNGHFAACAMEAAAYIAGEPWSDHPECVCPVIAAFMRAWNDELPDNAERTRLLLPLIPKTIGTRGSDALAKRRSLMAADWLVRVQTPAWLRLAGLTDHANRLAGLPEITSMAQVPSIRGPVEAASADADAARAAAWAAAWAAAENAARAAAENAEWDAARAAARDAAWAAAEAAAWAAAEAAELRWDAAWDRLAPITAELQASAVSLVDRMIAAPEAAS